MLVTNNTNQDYWFGPLHIPALASNVSVDDTTATSLYLTDDGVADAINTLAAALKITVTGAATPFPRPTGTPEVLHGDGSPEGLVYAGQGSIFLRRDSGTIYSKTSGVHLNTGWSLVGAGSGGSALTSVQAFASGPPANPSDKDIWVATDVEANGSGIRWVFQYNAGSSSAYKWEFIGGSPILRTCSGSSGGNAGYFDLSSAYTTVRAGDYIIRGSGDGGGSGGGWGALIQVLVNGASIWGSPGVSVTYLIGSHDLKALAVGAGQVIKVQGHGDGGSGVNSYSYTVRTFIVPTRVA